MAHIAHFLDLNRPDVPLVCRRLISPEPQTQGYRVMEKKNFGKKYIPSQDAEVAYYQGLKTDDIAA